MFTFSAHLALWYEKNHRKLPWRETLNPYKIWVSEVILQQTRVDQGLMYYKRFVAQFPDIASLAKAEEKSILKLWEGLGYYSRARNMHTAAKQIMDEFGGIFPKEHKDILSLKGIGDYTAAAISSFAYKKAEVLIDGNVARFIGRFYGISSAVNSTQNKKELREKLELIIDKENPDIFNQAIMEFGALACTPSNPKCKECPFAEHCFAFNENRVSEFPVKAPKTKVRNRYFHYIIIIDENSNTLIEERTGKDVWEKLFQFPLVEKTRKSSMEKIKGDSFLMKTGDLKFIHQFDHKHILSHQHIYARFFVFKTPNLNTQAFLFNNYILVNKKNLKGYPFPRLIEKYIPDIFFN